MTEKPEENKETVTPPYLTWDDFLASQKILADFNQRRRSFWDGVFTSQSPTRETQITHADVNGVETKFTLSEASEDGVWRLVGFTDKPIEIATDDIYEPDTFERGGYFEAQAEVLTGVDASEAENTERWMADLAEVSTNATDEEFHHCCFLVNSKPKCVCGRIK